MTRLRAAAGSLLFLVVAPGTMGGLVPWLITGWRGSSPPWALRVLGLMALCAGIGVLLEGFVRFVAEGRGTPAPVAPTQELVVGGIYRHVRNPMYLAVTLVILGQASLLARGELAWYGGAFLAVTASFVRLYEEPTLLRRHGEQYEAYRANVPGWVPRLRPWKGDPGRTTIAP